MGGKPMALFSQTIRSVLFKWADFQTDLIPKRMRYQRLPKQRVQRLCWGLFSQVKGGTARDHNVEANLLLFVLCFYQPVITLNTTLFVTKRAVPPKLPGFHSFHYLFLFLIFFCRGTNLAKIRMAVEKNREPKKKKNHKNPQGDEETKGRQVGGWGGENLPSWVHICSCRGFLIALPWQPEQCWKALSVQRWGWKWFPPSCI